jgi:hypothetical protein
MMILLLISMLLRWTPLAQEAKEIDFDVRARQSLLMGHGANSGRPFYDVIITGQPTAGVLIKLPYTKKGGKFSFDLYHRIAMTDDFGQPAEVTTVIDVLNGGGISVGKYTIADMIQSGDKFAEDVKKTSNAEIDRYITPLGGKTITLDIKPGPQSISIVGALVVITRGPTTTQVDTPGTRVAVVSNFKYLEYVGGTPLK